MQKNVTLESAQLEQEQKPSPVLSDLLESLSLISKTQTNLFMNKTVLGFLKKTVYFQDQLTRFKKQIIYKTQFLDPEPLLTTISQFSHETFQEIGQEFFYHTAKKFAKSQPIEKYSEFLRIMETHFQNDTQFWKAFLTPDRDYNEVITFLNFVKYWREKIDDIFLFFLEKFSVYGNFYDFLQIIGEFDLKNKRDIFIHHMQYILQKDGLDYIQQSFDVFSNLQLQFDISLQNKILDFVNKYNKNREYLNLILDNFEQKNIKKDIMTYNIIMDYHCGQGEFEKSYDIFKSLEQKNLVADLYSYSILIKGIKNQDEPDIQLGLNLFSEYQKQNQPKEIIIFNSVLDLLINTENSSKVDNIFSKIENDSDLIPDEITFNTIIKGCCKNKDFETAYKYFLKMENFSLKPNRITYNTMMDLAVKVGKMKEALLIVEQMQTQSILPDSFTYSILLNGLKLNKSSKDLVSICIKKMKIILQADEFKQDLVLYNSILDVCSQYEMYREVDSFHLMMKERKLKENPQTLSILIHAYVKANNLKKAFESFEYMINSGIKVREITYGQILDACTKNGQMNLAIKIYESLQEHMFNMNSIVFTTIIKGFLKSKHYNEALQFFEKIKHLTELPGMVITYNCALDIYATTGEIEKAINLFEEIQTKFNADLISYSTIIKALLKVNKKENALEKLKCMITSEIKMDVSVVNLFLDNCASKQDYHLAIDGYKFSMMKGIAPNEITFGIMVKVFGFARQLHQAFELLDLMKVYKIAPSIIIFTNLIHISFYCRNPRKAELAFTLFRKEKLDGDAMLYSKIIDGLVRFRKINKVPKYIQYCLKEKCSLKPHTIENLKKYFKNKEMLNNLEKISENAKLKRPPHKNVHQIRNTYNLENPKKFKQIIRENRIKDFNTNQTPVKRDGWKKKEKSYGGFGKKVQLFNFRKKKVD